MTKFYFLLAAISLFFAGCKTASKAYQKGDYADAIELGVKKLQKEPHDRETRDLVQNAYNYAVTAHEDKIRILSNSRSDTRYEEIYREYRKLQDLYQTINGSPVASRQIKTNDYSEYVEIYREKAAGVYLEKADYWTAQGTKQGYREAYNQLKMAQRFMPNDFALERRKDSVYNLAVTRVLIVPMQNMGGFSFASSRLQNFQNDVVRTLSYGINNEFIRFHSEWDARNRDIEPDQILELNIGRITIGQPQDTRNVREISREVVVKEIVHSPDSVTRQYGTVTAKITTTKRILLSEGDLYITLRDTKGKTIWSDRFTGQHKWQTEFTSYTGDERALSQADKNLVANSPETTQPQQEDIMNELFRQMQTDLSTRLRSFYSRY